MKAACMQCGAAGASYKEMTVVYSWLWTLDNVDIKFWRKDITALLTDTVNLERKKRTSCYSCCNSQS